MPEPVRILVVDDTEANRYAVARHLRQAGYTVLEAARRSLRRWRRWPSGHPIY